MKCCDTFLDLASGFRWGGGGVLKLFFRTPKGPCGVSRGVDPHRCRWTHGEVMTSVFWAFNRQKWLAGDEALSVLEYLMASDILLLSNQHGNNLLRTRC
jgi:hypothetical protein